MTCREEVQYCDNNCQKYVSLWEANNHSEFQRALACGYTYGRTRRRLAGTPLARRPHAPRTLLARLHAR